jgi:hypothetical protein
MNGEQTLDHLTNHSNVMQSAIRRNQSETSQPNVTPPPPITPPVAPRRRFTFTRTEDVNIPGSTIIVNGRPAVSLANFALDAIQGRHGQNAGTFTLQPVVNDVQNEEGGQPLQLQPIGGGGFAPLMENNARVSNSTQSTVQNAQIIATGNANVSSTITYLNFASNNDNTNNQTSSESSDDNDTPIVRTRISSRSSHQHSHHRRAPSSSENNDNYQFQSSQPLFFPTLENSDDNDVPTTERRIARGRFAGRRLLTNEMIQHVQETAQQVTNSDSTHAQNSQAINANGSIQQHVADHTMSSEQTLQHLSDISNTHDLFISSAPNNIQQNDQNQGADISQRTAQQLRSSSASSTQNSQINGSRVISTSNAH